MESFPEGSCELENFLKVMEEFLILDEKKLNAECDKTPTEEQFFDDDS